jgi:hypothetical protein
MISLLAGAGFVGGLLTLLKIAILAVISPVRPLRPGRGSGDDEWIGRPSVDARLFRRESVC